jgi:hypothetical protein
MRTNIPMSGVAADDISRVESPALRGCQKWPELAGGSTKYRLS